MIQNKTARAMLYDYHGGQWSPFYAAASSGLVESFPNLMRECETIRKTIPESQKDMEKLVTWLTHQSTKRNAVSVVVRGITYGVLPWVSRSY